jgi:hypothetical protein
MIGRRVFGPEEFSRMLLQTNSYIVPKDKRADHARIIRRFRQTLLRLGCDHFEVYEQVGSNWSNSESTGRYVQILRFTDRKQQLAVQVAERSDPTAQAVIAEFCDLINFPYQQQQGLFAVGFYTSVLPIAPKRGSRNELVTTVDHDVVSDDEDGASDAAPSDTAEEGEASHIGEDEADGEHTIETGSAEGDAAEASAADAFIDAETIDHSEHGKADDAPATR